MPRHKWSPTCPPPRDLVRPVPVDPTGANGPTRGQARGRRWRQSSYGMYVPAHVDAGVPEQRVLEQSVRLPKGGAVTGWGSCRLHQATFFDGLMPDGATPFPVPLCAGPRAQLLENGECTVSRERLPVSEVVRRFGIPCTVPLRALFDEMRSARDLREAVVAMDMMAAAELVSISQMCAYVAERAGWVGVEQVRRALRLADENSRSPNETRMRLVWQLDADLPRPLVNKDVFTVSGKFLGCADLFDPEAGVVGEYDGADHRGALRHSRDVLREERFRRAGLEYFKITGPDMSRPQRMVDRMHSTRARAKWLPERQRAWTIDPPPGWPVSRSLDDELELRRVMAEVYEEQERLASGE
ncbi:MAG: hypothetical protein ACRDPJ_21865 [Nocardioidaceae bacterium]